MIICLLLRYASRQAMDESPKRVVQEANGKAAADLVRSQFIVAYPSLPVEVVTSAKPSAPPEAAGNSQQEVEAAPGPSQVTGAEVRWVSCIPLSIV